MFDLDDEVVNENVDGNDDGNGGGDILQPILQIQLDCTCQTLFRLNSCQLRFYWETIIYYLTYHSYEEKLSML